MSEHKRIIMEFFDANSTRNLDTLIDFMVKYHHRKLGYEKWSKIMKGTNYQLFQGFSDLRMDIEDGWIIEEGERCATTYRVTGTHDGMFFGLPPTDLRINDTGSLRTIYKDGEIHFIYIYWDLFKLFTQLGVEILDLATNTSSSKLPDVSIKALQSYIQNAKSMAMEE